MDPKIEDLDALVGACRKLGMDPMLCTKPKEALLELAMLRASRPDLGGLAELLSARLRNLSAPAIDALQRQLQS